MADKDTTNLSRRGFLATAATAAAAGAGVVLGGAKMALGGDPASDTETAGGNVVGKRPFGKTGVDVAELSLGGMFDTINGQVLLSQSLEMGVTYWDTAVKYGGGNSETGMGNYLSTHTDQRKNMFLVSKSPKRTHAELTTDLDESLERLQTDYLDLFFLHAINDPDHVTSELTGWGDEMKAAGKLKFFGLSTHDNMSACMNKAVELGGIDGMMISYNYRILVQDDEGDGRFNKAIDACHEAGIGLTAMKTQGGRNHSDNSEAEDDLIKEFTDSGYSPEQAALKVVWKDERMAAVCSQMPNMTLLKANVAAALDKTELTARQEAALRKFAVATASDYCAGCSQICSRAVGGEVPVCDILRFVMYYNTYGDRFGARELFAALPAGVRNRLTSLDYSTAEARCPQGVPIAARMKLAQELLA